MKRLFLFALFAFVACTQETIDEVSAVREDAAETITVGFEDDATRIQLNEAQKTVWTKDDLVSVFYRTNGNQKWQYQGETGERQGTLKRVENVMGSVQTTKTVVVYPYSENYWLNTNSYCIDAMLPAVQYYAEGSYGVGSNLMVSQGEFTQFSLKSVCGWLKLQLTGNGEVVKSIKFRGNNGEQVAGLIYVDTATAESTLASEMGDTEDNNAGGNLFFDDTILTEVVLDCGAGVELGAEATPFYIALPPQTFVGGFTVEVECDGYELMTLSTENELVIERNTIQPMASVEHNAEQIIPNNEIWYTNGSTTEATIPYKTNVFGANIVSNTYDAAKECWVIKFDSEVTTIGERAFDNCSSLTSVTIPNSVTEIGDAAFEDCYGLTSITIPDSVTSIGNEAFYFCSSLTSITIPDSVTEIGRAAFTDCRSLTSITIPNSVTTIRDNAFYCCHSLTSVTIPNSVTTIGNYVFAYCNSLTSVTIPDSVTSIGNNVFYECTSLTSVTIPDSVTSIGNNAFYSCLSLTSVTIPDSVTEIEDSAFAHCSNLTSVTIPDSVTSIGNEAFYDCNKLTSVTISDSVTSIGEWTFANCFSLTSVTIPDSVTTIGNYAFEDCSSLASVTIPDSVTSIGGSAFGYCSSLASVYCKATTPPAGGSSMFSFNASGRKIYVPAESVDAYKNAKEWSDYADAIVAYDFENNKVVNSVEFNPNNCIYYRTNSTGGWDSGWNNYRRTDSYIECGGGGNTLEMKFKLEPFSGEVWLAASGNLAKDYCDELIIDESTIELILRGRDDDGEGYTVYYKSWKLADFGVSSTDLITLTLSGETITINGKTLSCPSIPYMAWSYIFSNYYRESDEGEWKVYEGVPENSALYYVKMCDADGNVSYLGHADKSVNPATNNMEYCWYSNKSGTEEYQFANDAVNQGGYGGNF